MPIQNPCHTHLFKLLLRQHHCHPGVYGLRLERVYYVCTCVQLQRRGTPRNYSNEGKNYTSVRPGTEPGISSSGRIRLGVLSRLGTQHEEEW